MKLEDFNNIDKINNINDIFLTIILAIFITMIFYLLVPYNHYNLYFNFFFLIKNINKIN